MFAAGCTHPDAARDRVLAETPNPKFDLICLFYGQEVKLDTGADVKAVDFVAVRDARTRREVRFKPEDAPSLHQSLGYYKDVWSPDGEYLVLPLGRFEGFAVFKSTEAMNLIAAGKTGDYLRIQLDNGTRLWHKFDGWTDAGSFKFEAGLSNDLAPFRYSIRENILIAETSKPVAAVAYNSKGPMAIQRGPMLLDRPAAAH